MSGSSQASDIAETGSPDCVWPRGVTRAADGREDFRNGRFEIDFENPGALGADFQAAFGNSAEGPWTQVEAREIPCPIAGTSADCRHDL